MWTMDFKFPFIHPTYFKCILPSSFTSGMTNDLKGKPQWVAKVHIVDYLKLQTRSLQIIMGMCMGKENDKFVVYYHANLSLSLWLRAMDVYVNVVASIWPTLLSNNLISCEPILCVFP